MISRSIASAFLGCLLTACAASSTNSPALPRPDRELVLPTEGYLKTYANGLTLFVVPDRYTGLVQLDMRQRVGTREDQPGKALAHFVEHLMFQIPVAGPGSAA